MWYQITSNGGTGLNFDTQVRLIVDPQSTCISAPPKISVCGSTSKLYDVIDFGYKKMKFWFKKSQVTKYKN